MASGLGGRRLARAVEAVHLARQGLSAATQIRREFNIDAAPRLAIKDGSARYRTVEHLFKAKCLSTELHQVAVSGFTSAAFVFDRKGLWAKFDDIGTTGKTEVAAGQRHTTYCAKILATDLAGKIRMLM